MGPRDLENGTIEVVRRDTLEKKVEQIETIEQVVEDLLTAIQDNIYAKALKFREENTTKVDSYEEFKAVIELQREALFLAHWDGTTLKLRSVLKMKQKATIRCIPFEGVEEEGKCMVTGKPSKRRVIFALSY